MNKKRSANLWQFFAILIILLGSLLITVYLVSQNQENRSKAEENKVVLIENDDSQEVENMCGKADELPALSRPVDNLCSLGSPVWIDSVASSGLYRWKCVDEVSGESGECSAVLEN